MKLFQNLNLILSRISRFILVNGPGRSVAVEETNGVGDPSGFSTFFSQLMTNIGNALVNLGEFLLRILARLAYFIVKIALNIMDFMNVIIKELSGQATAYNLTENASLEESDILFQFLFNELTLKLLQDVFVFAFLLIIIFTIMAIVKQEWQNHITGDAKNVKKVFKKVLQAIFTMIIVPFIMIVGIVFSNVVLASAMGAFSGDRYNYSIGAQIFNSSSNEANKYRLYAEAGVKIPIVFDYDGGFENSVETTLPTLPESSTNDFDTQFNELMESGNFETGQSAYNMFKNETFFAFNSIPDESSFYSIYDGEYLRTKQIEYYAMADYLDFALLSGGTYYIVNTEEVFMTTFRYIYNNSYGLDAYGNLNINILSVDPDSVADEKELERKLFVADTLSSVVDHIRIYDEKGKDLWYESNGVVKVSSSKLIPQIIRGVKQIDYFEFDVLYDKSKAELLGTQGIVTDTDEPESTSKLTYRSIAGSTDEITGAKYIVCQKVTLDEYGGFVYVPLRVGDRVNGYNFKSSFISSAPYKTDPDTGKLTDEKTRRESFILARGVFTSAGYPTAIREQGNNIVYYRQDPTMPSAFNFAQIFNYQSPSDLESNEGQPTGGAFNIGDVTEFLTGVDVSTLIPDIRINLNLMRAFSKDEVVAAISDGGKYAVNYSFVGSGFAMTNLYDELKLNYVVLLVAVVLLFKSLFYIIWGLIQRLYEITLLWITFPGFVAKHPIEDADSIGAGGTSFTTWKEKVIERVIALYSIYISLAIVLMLIPIVFNIEYIVGYQANENSMFMFEILNTDTANLVIKTMFVLVLFSMLNIDPKGGTSGLPRIIEQVILWSSSDSGYLTDIGAKTISELKEMKVKAINTFTVGGIARTVKGAALNASNATLNAIPGRAIFDKAVDAVGNKKFNKKNDAMLQGAQSDLLSNSTTDADVEAQTKNLEQATKDHAYMENYRRARSDNRRQTGGVGKNFKDFRASRGKTAGVEGSMKEVAQYGASGKPDDTALEKLGKILKGQKVKKKKNPKKIYKDTRKRTGV